MSKVFTKKDFNNNNGMLTSVWGPSLWHVLHSISFNYPIHPTDKDKKKYADFLYSLADVLPCKYCRINLPSNMKKTKFSIKVLNNRNTFSRWVYKLHEEVNKMLGKESNLTYNEVRERYEHFRARCSQKKEKQLGGNKEKGCNTSIYGIKSKCVLSIVPHNKKKNSFTMDPKCKKKRM